MNMEILRHQGRTIHAEVKGVCFLDWIKAPVASRRASRFNRRAVTITSTVDFCIVSKQRWNSLSGLWEHFRHFGVI